MEDMSMVRVRCAGTAADIRDLICSEAWQTETLACGKSTSERTITSSRMRINDAPFIFCSGCYVQMLAELDKFELRRVAKASHVTSCSVVHLTMILSADRC